MNVGNTESSATQNSVNSDFSLENGALWNSYEKKKEILKPLVRFDFVMNSGCLVN